LFLGVYLPFLGVGGALPPPHTPNLEFLMAIPRDPVKFQAI
jgi:hypothetical protein